MTLALPLDITTVKGFLDPLEAEALYDCALDVAGRAPVLEIGSYCGKSTVYLGLACRERDATLFAVDHHRGSEEHQRGEQYHDPTLFDIEADAVDTFGEFRRTIRRAGLGDTVVPIVASSTVAARHWATPLSMVFIDGGHSLDAAMNDYRAWVGHVIGGGILAIHDLFADPADGGQAPITIYRLALASGLFEELPQIGTLGLLRRL